MCKELMADVHLCPQILHQSLIILIFPNKPHHSFFSKPPVDKKGNKIFQSQYHYHLYNLASTEKNPIAFIFMINVPIPFIFLNSDDVFAHFFKKLSRRIHVLTPIIKHLSATAKFIDFFIYFSNFLDSHFHKTSNKIIIRNIDQISPQ